MTEISTDKNREDDASFDFPTGECAFVSSWGNVRLQISYDAMEVVVVKVDGDASLCNTLTSDALSAFFHENRIVHGVLPEALRELTDSLVLDATWEGTLVVAEGRPPTVPGVAEYTMFKGAKEVVVAGGDVMIVDGATVAFSAIKNYLAQQRDSTDIPDSLAKLVHGGAVLVTKTPPLQGHQGCDVFGRVIAPPEFGEVVAGENVELSADNSTFSASFFGYPLVIDRTLSVLSPIVVADDRMTAWYVQLRQLPRTISPFLMDLTILLKHAGLTRETEGGRVEDLYMQLGREKGPGWYVAAKGREPVAGKDGVLIFKGMDHPSALRDDGSIDFKVINLVKTVEADSHFATLLMPTEGDPGYTLLGEELPTQPGIPLKVDAKGNVRVEECDNGDVRYYSETEGVIQYKNGQLEIDPLYQVKGNVDFSTGNIDVDCCLTVAGNVCSDFTVKSSKDVVISGTLEPGSKVVVQGNLQVKGGIIGENTEVMVLGDLQAEYVQDAKIVVKGQILINQYAFSAVIRSVGSVQVGPGIGERGGSIVGGTICSSASIEAKTIGSPSNVLTIVVVEPAPHKLAKLKELKKQIVECEASIAKIMRTLDLEAIKPDLVKQLLQNATPPQRELYIEILNQLNLLVKKQHAVMTDKNHLRDELWQDVDKMSVLVNKACFSNTKVRIARKEFLNRADRGRTHVTHDRQQLRIA